MGGDGLEAVAEVELMLGEQFSGRRAVDAERSSSDSEATSTSTR